MGTFILSRTEDVLKETNNELNTNTLGFKKKIVILKYASICACKYSHTVNNDDLFKNGSPYITRILAFHWVGELFFFLVLFNDLFALVFVIRSNDANAEYMQLEISVTSITGIQ